MNTKKRWAAKAAAEKGTDPARLDTLALLTQRGETLPAAVPCHVSTGLGDASLLSRTRLLARRHCWTHNDAADVKSCSYKMLLGDLQRCQEQGPPV